MIDKKRGSKNLLLLVIMLLLSAVITALLIVDVMIGKEVFNFNNPLVIENWITMVAAIVLLGISLKNYLR